MVEMRNRLTGSVMSVADDRVAEYLARGHSLLAEPEPTKRPEPVEKPKKKPTKKKRG